MALERRSVPYGEPALLALREAITEAQAGDVLAPVTVLVHSNAVGVAARRWLAAHDGVAAAQFLTVFRLAELLGGPALAAAGKRPVSTPVIEVAARHALASSSGLFQPIAAHQATVAALRTTYRELRHVPDGAWGRLAGAGSPRAREVVRLCRAVQRRLEGEWYDEAALVHTAAAACRAGTGLPPGRVVVYLPQRLRATELELLEALALRGPVVVIEGRDELPHPPALEVVDASDADEEVREAVRIVVAAAHAGTPLHRIGVVWPGDVPYARLVGDHLDDAGVLWNGRPGVALHERLAARLVLDVFRLDRRGIRRADLFALLAHVPARTSDGTPVPRQRWERLSRAAGLAGDADWGLRLDAYADASRATGREHEAEAALALQAFVGELREELGPPGLERPWSHWSTVAHRLLHRWLSGHRGVQGLPAEEFEAHGQVQAALDRLSRLDTLTGPVTREVAAQTLEAELEQSPGRVGRVGVGVHAGPLSFAVGQPFDLLVVVGACEGSLPAPPPAEALLADADRALTDGALPLEADITADQRHRLWAALAGTTRAVLVRPRGDLRATAERQPSRWITELTAVAPAARRSVASFAAGLSGAAFPATLGQHRVRALVHAAASGADLAQHPLVAQVPALEAGAALVAARASTAFTEYDGDLSGLAIDPLGDRPVSTTRIESWVSCPHAWFVQQVLRVDPVEQPDEQLQITPRDRGNLVHRVLDHFHRAVIDGSLPQPGPSGWGAEHEAALLAWFEEEAANLQRVGLVGRRAFWQAERVRQRRELLEWLQRDGELVVARGARVLASEHRFGMPPLPGHEHEPPVPPAEIHLADGTVVRFRGSVDRIDRCADGRLVVTDHKTGSTSSYKDITDADPTAGGTRFQLPAYAAAARALAGLPPDAPVLAEYGFLGSGDYARLGCTVDAGNLPVVQAVLSHVVAGIRSRLFVPLPGKAQYRLSFIRCSYCDPDGLGTADRWAEFERKLADPRVAALLGVLTEQDGAA